jgi:hypothetical protein
LENRKAAELHNKTIILSEDAKTGTPGTSLKEHAVDTVADALSELMKELCVCSSR